MRPTLGATAQATRDPGLATGCTRADLVAFADRLIASAQRYASPGHARITLPGDEGGYGRAVDGLEGFARTFLLAGFRIAGERGEGLDELIDWYATGLSTGTDPHSTERWVRLDEHAQAKVEAASIALILDLTRPWLWDRLTPRVQEQVVDYLSPAVGDDTYPRINWVWFRLVVQTFLRSVGGPHSLTEMAEDLATHDTFQRPGGWLSDGAERSYDHYVGWALHAYPTLWARMAGASDLAAERGERDRLALDRYLLDAVELVGGDGSPLLQGRSLIYRFAAAAPFWVGALAGVPSLRPGQLRRAATGIVGHFAQHGVPDADGLLTLGWHAPWPRLAQSYSGPGSPYWASKGLLGIALPAGHPVWSEPEQPLPVEVGDTLRAIVAPGWLVAGTRADGLVRVVNHGTDHAVEGATCADSPLYARLGYSTATSPLLDESGWVTPVDQSVTLVDAAGRASHRTGMATLDVQLQGHGDSRLGVAGSTVLAHWVDTEPGQRDHGSGRAGAATPAGRITVWSLVRGAHEVRLVRVDDPATDPAGLRLRIGGWPVAGSPAAGDGEATVGNSAVCVTGGRLTSRMSALSGAPAAGVSAHNDAGPLGGPVRVPWLDHPVQVGDWQVTLLELSGAATPEPLHPCTATLHHHEDGLLVRVDWPDGVRTRTHLSPIPTHVPRGAGHGDPVALGPDVRAPGFEGEG